MIIKIILIDDFYVVKINSLVILLSLTKLQHNFNIISIPLFNFDFLFSKVLKETFS
jgi:hypothetical protein